jgi:hypothetical protein
MRVTVAGPATMFRVPAFSGVWIDDDRLVGSGAELCDERGDKRWMCAVDPDGCGLGKGGDSGCTLAERFAVCDVLRVATGEREPCGEFEVMRESLTYGFRFG